MNYWQIKINEESNDASEMKDVEQESLENGGGKYSYL